MENDCKELEILLIRHGESEINHLMDKTPNEEKILAGATFWAQLTEKGISQSKLLGKYLKENYPDLERISSSPYIRAQQTLRYCMEEITCKDKLYSALSKVDIAMELREHYQGSWEGMKKSEIGYFKHLAKATSEPEFFYKTRFPGGESPEEVGQRAGKYLEKEILNKGISRAALFTHRGTIIWLLHHMFKIPIVELFEKKIDNASVSCIYLDKKGALKYETERFIPNI